MKSARWWGMILGLMVVSQAYADHIFVSGDVTGTWAVDTVFVTGEIRVPPGEALVIEPGVKVLFEGWYKLIVDSSATLAAFGSLSDSIYFMPTYWEGWPLYSGWFGIRFLYADNTSILNFCSLTYASAYLESGGSMENQSGGGIHCKGSSPTITNCLIDHCFADYYGGGIYCANGSQPIISNSTLTANQANVGGAIYCLGSSPHIFENVISLNTAIWGGAIAAEYQSHPEIRNNLISGNLAMDYNSIGAGVFLNESSWSILCNNIITGNFSSTNCGGIWCGHSSNATVVGNIIRANHSYYSGGGISCIDADLSLTNNTIADNLSDVGVGGGIYLWGSNPVIRNCIFWNNTLGQIDVAYQSEPQIIYCDIQGGWPGTGNINLDPQFLNPDSGDYHLSLTSPCIDAGNPDTQYNDPEDPANPGFALWPALGTIRNDMGAYGGSGASGWVGISSNPPVAQPTEFKLEQNFPNPFNTRTVLSFELPVPSKVGLRVYDTAGRLVTTLMNGWRQAGRHEVTFDGSGLASGVYIYRLEAGGYSAAGKMVLLK